MLSTRGHTYRPLVSFLDVRTPSHAAGCSGGLASSLVDDRYVYSSRFLRTRNNAGPWVVWPVTLSLSRINQ